jgi:hypothetical protein
MADKAIERLRAAIKGRSRDEVVEFEGQDLLVGYGIYLLRYLEGEQLEAETLAKAGREKSAEPSAAKVWDRREAQGKTAAVHGMSFQKRIHDMTYWMPDEEGDP